MVIDKILRNCLIISFLLHGVFIAANLSPRWIFPKISGQKKIEVTYFRPTDYKKAARLPDNITASDKDVIKTHTPAPAPWVGKPQKAVPQKAPALKTKKLLFNKPVALSVKPIVSEKMLVSYNSKDLTNEPSYMKYRGLVWAKIKDAANENKPYMFKTGAVNLVFTILNTGDLRSVSLIKDTSTSDPALHRCALDSVYAASPFPPFSGDIKEGHLTLRLTISFEK
ncbi:MAG: hypothetical protein JW946_00450 [Candidatus Omnitrophica bacterium]|nr:hypothetical protein [Candidatus Omnitrophota bacterium]